MKKISLLLLILVLFSCKEKKQQKVIITCNVPNKFQMYKASEMASLMRRMVEEHQLLKEQILQEKAIGNFNEKYLNLHTAKLTVSSDRDPSFEFFSENFIKMQKELFKVPSAKRKETYNSIINLCVACHQGHCSGPIPRIKKLLIP